MESTGEKSERTERVYVFVCKGDSCSKRGHPDRVRVAIKQVLRDFPAQSVKLSFVSCLSMCGEGPNVLICKGGTAFHRCSGPEAGAVAQEVRGILERPDP
jgi:NADH:ubiquinone oxidoreductase subunit E